MPSADILLVAVTPVEIQAVLQAHRTSTGFGHLEVTLEQRKYFDLGKIASARVYLCLTEMGASGRGASQDAVRSALECLNPSAVFSVGLAFGANSAKQSIGTILVSERLVPYEAQRVGPHAVVARSARPAASTRLRQFCKVRHQTWTGAPVEFGPLLSGEKLVDNLAFRDSLLALEPEAVGGEMEGVGLYVACEEKRVDWIVVKAICDWADGNKSGPNKNECQQLAARNAASFVMDVLATSDFTTPAGGPNAPRRVPVYYIDWRTAGGFYASDRLLEQLTDEKIPEQTRFEYCFDALLELEPALGKDGAFAREATRVFQQHIRRSAGEGPVDLRDAKTALLVAYELMSKYSEFGRALREGSGKASAGSPGRRRLAIPRHFERIYPNTVNSFIKDIVLMTLDRGASRKLNLTQREADIAAASKYIIGTTKFGSSASRLAESAGPEVHAAYTLGRIQSPAAQTGAIDELRAFEKRLSAVIDHLHYTEERRARQIYLMRRTSVLSQSMLGDKDAAMRYLHLLLNDKLESDVNAGFHLEYYADQPLDETLPLCSHDLGQGCANTVSYLSACLLRAMDGGWDLSKSPLTLIEVYTLSSIVARRISSSLKATLAPTVQLLEQIQQRLEPSDLRLYVDLCIEMFRAPPGHAAKELGCYLAAKNAPRSGWVRRNVAYPETVGAHTAGVLWLCNLIAEEYESQGLKVSHIKDMIEVHDLAEGITGDIVATHKDDDHDEHERRLMRRMSWLGTYISPQVNLYSLYTSYKEFHERQTPESKIAHELDWIDIVLQGQAILASSAQCDREGIATLISKMESRIKTPTGRQVLSLAVQMNVISKASFSGVPDADITRYYF
jgi:nucleoside phosphorylase/5'-deoxynucleotidase YfbR-like HD superfamily hydrolase